MRSWAARDNYCGGSIAVTAPPPFVVNRNMTRWPGSTLLPASGSASLNVIVIASQPALSTRSRKMLIVPAVQSIEFTAPTAVCSSGVFDQFMPGITPDRSVFSVTTDGPGVRS